MQSINTKEEVIVGQAFFHSYPKLGYEVFHSFLVDRVRPSIHIYYVNQSEKASEGILFRWRSDDLLVRTCRLGRWKNEYLKWWIKACKEESPSRMNPGSTSDIHHHIKSKPHRTPFHWEFNSSSYYFSSIKGSHNHRAWSDMRIFDEHLILTLAWDSNPLSTKGNSAPFTSCWNMYSFSMLGGISSSVKLI